MSSDTERTVAIVAAGVVAVGLGAALIYLILRSFTTPVPT